MTKIIIALSIVLTGCGASVEVADPTPEPFDHCVMEQADQEVCPGLAWHVRCPTMQEAVPLNPANRCRMTVQTSQTFLCCIGVGPGCC